MSAGIDALALEATRQLPLLLACERAGSRVGQDGDPEVQSLRYLGEHHVPWCREWVGEGSSLEKSMARWSGPRKRRRGRRTGMGARSPVLVPALAGELEQCCFLFLPTAAVAEIKSEDSRKVLRTVSRTYSKYSIG